jgi:predicted nucleic acid-binding protein
VIVVDTNVIAYLMLNGDRTREARGVFLKDPEWTAPVFWRSEFRNVLAQYLQRNEISLHQALRVMGEAEQLLRDGEYEVPSSAVLELVSSSRCSAYDCEFVALARAQGIPLVTSDRQLLKAFPEYALSPEAFLKR